MEETARIAREIMRNTTRESTRSLYAENMKEYEALLRELGSDYESPDFSASRKVESDPTLLACAYILKWSGPSELGYEEWKASSTGEAARSAIVNYWRSKEYDGEYVKLPDGSYSGNPGRSPYIKALINRLDEQQRADRKQLITRAYQRTHEDVRWLYYGYVEPHIGRGIRRDPTVDYSSLQAACSNIMQFETLARGAEILSLQVRDLMFTGDSPDSPIVGILPVTKSRKREYVNFRFSRGVDISICALRAIQGWLCVLRAHNLDDGKMFLKVISNKLQGGMAIDGTSYGRILRDIGQNCGIFGLAEHSPQRGGAGFNYFVLRKDVCSIYRAFSWDDRKEMFKYIGIDDEQNSYAKLGFSIRNQRALFPDKHIESK